MIFRQWQQVLDGAKTQTRRPVKDGEFIGPDEVRKWKCGRRGNTSPALDWTVKWAVGRTYAIQPGRGKKAVGRMHITEIRRERLQDISRDDIEAEGTPCNPMNQMSWRNDYYQRLRDFAWLWNSIYKKPPHRWEDNPEVWALTLEVVKP